MLCISGNLDTTIFFIYQVTQNIIPIIKIVAQVIPTTTITEGIEISIDRTISSVNKVNSLLSSCSNTGSIRDDSYWTSRENSLELIELSSINKVSLV
jgi:hypothetical protein